jgi:non-ribosomal peptide synthetase component F
MQGHLAGSILGYEGPSVYLDLDQLAKEQRDTNPTHPGSAATLAYVLYTSGSSGKPKGVAIEHSSVMRLFSVTRSWFAFSEADVWTMFHSYAFDFSVWELWGALLF